MGKFKVSFTTALFVFSFFVCVIVAVVFVDRNSAPREDNGFYETGNNASRAADSPPQTGAPNSVWENRRGAQPGATTPAPPAEDPSLADLPLDPHLMGAAQTVPLTSVTPQPTINPMVGRSPEQVLHQLQRNPHLRGANTPAAVPGLPVPEGIATPAYGAPSAGTPAAQQGTPRTYLPMQSNISSPGSGVGAPLGAGSGGIQGMSNSGAGWNTTTNQQLPSHLIGTQGSPLSPNDGTMITRDRVQPGAQAPPGFSNTVTNPGSSLPSLSSPSSDDYSPLPPHLRSTPDAPALDNKWDLPPAPTLAPPLIQAPGGGPQSDAGDETTVPGDTSLEESIDQALAVSAPETEQETTEEPQPASAEPAAIAVRVNDKELTEDEAARLARVAAQLRKKQPNETAADPQDQITQSIREWTATTAAAEQARKNELTVTAAEIDKYLAAQKDFDASAWKKAMASAGFTRKQIDEQLADRALAEKLIEKQFEKQYDEDKLKTAYNKAPKTYSTPYQVQVQEIFRARPTEENRVEQVKKEMQRLRRQASGTDFSLLARQVSEAPSKSQGGDLGWKTPSDKKDATIAKAVADLKEGEISEMIESDDGFRIYRVAATREARDSFETSRELVAEKLREDLRESVLADARKEQKVELGPTKDIRMVTTEKTTVSTPPEIKTEQASSSSAGATSGASSSRRTESAAPRATPQSGHLLAAPGGTAPASPTTNIAAPAATAQPVAQGGAPGPVHQPGGQPAPSSGGYYPGQTMVVGGNGGNTATAAPVAIGEATPIPGLSPEMQARQLQSMQQQQRGAEAQRNQQVEAQVQAARAYAEQQEQQRAEENAMRAAAQATPSNVTHSNGWRVTRTDQSAEAPAVVEQQPASQIPPGFEGNTSEGNSRQREGGVLNNVRTFFSRNRD